MARRETTLSGMLGDLQILLTALEEGGGGLAHLESSRARLETMLVQARDAAKQQAAAAAQKQEATKQLQTLVTDSNRLAAALRGMIREHYGTRSEELTRFGIKPFRGRARKAKGDAQASPEASGPPVAG